VSGFSLEAPDPDAAGKQIGGFALFEICPFFAGVNPCKSYSSKRYA
jgi:hypothetical protein